MHETDNYINYQKKFNINTERFETLRGEIENREKELAEKFQWNPDKDVRLRFFRAISNLIRSYSLSLYLGAENVSRSEWLQKTLHPETTNDAYQVIDQYEVFIRNGYIYSLAGLTEAWLRALLIGIDPMAPEGQAFWKMKSRLFANLDMQTDGHDFGEALNLLSTIRNCIHNNGTHTMDDKVISYKDKQYDFKKGNIQRHASTDTLLAITSDIMKMSLFMIGLKQVLNLSNVNGSM